MNHDLNNLISLLERDDFAELLAFSQFAGTDDFRIAWLENIPDSMCEELIDLWVYWQDMPREIEVPCMNDFRPEQISRVLGNLHVLEEQAESGELRYRLYGSAVAERYGADLTGQLLDANATGMKLLFHAVYHTVLRRQRPVYTCHIPPPKSTIRDCQRLILPMRNRAGELRSLLIGHFPMVVPRSSPAATL